MKQKRYSAARAAIVEAFKALAIATIKRLRKVIPAPGALRPMDTVHTTHYLGQPKNWDEGRHGPCETLAVNVNADLASSWWRVAFADRLRILFGQPVRLTIVGGQPAVLLQVQKP